MPPKDPLLGRLVAERYRLIQRLGSGGMADVYLARHVVIERLSAIKILHKDLGDHDASRDRFLREARAVNRLNHTNIVEITDYGESDGLVYLVMEYVPGEPLTRHLERGPLGWRRAAKIGMQVASALGRAHQMDVIHRDLKPSNVLVVAQRDGDDLVKLIDFGVAKMIDAPTITTSMVALGTPGYVAPEYGEYGNVDARSDLYSLGVVLYEATSGTLPFPANVPPGSLPLAPRPLSSFDPMMLPYFDDVVRTLLARDPDDRPRDGYEAVELIRRAIEPDRRRPPPPEPTSDRSIPDPASSGPLRRPGPHLTTVPFDRIAPVCMSALGRLRRSAAVDAALPPATLSALQHAAKHVSMVEAIAVMATSDNELIDAVEAQGRAVRADLGARLDAVARERSKTLGWAGTLAERTDLVRSRRDSGEHPIPAIEAMLWEQAALEQEEDAVRRRADELAEEAVAIQREIDRQNERLEHDMLVATARLEGHVAALRSMALEAWMDLDDAARRMGVTLADEG